MPINYQKHENNTPFLEKERKYKYKIGDCVKVKPETILANTRLATVDRFTDCVRKETATVIRCFHGNGLGGKNYYYIDYGNGRWLEVTENQIELVK